MSDHTGGAGYGHLGTDEKVAAARARARLAREQAVARRERVRADLAERRSISVEEARDAVMRLAAGVRRALDLMPSFLPADLTPEQRSSCERAMSMSVSRAMATITKEQDRAEEDRPEGA